MIKFIKEIINAFAKSQFSKKIVVVSTILFVSTYITNALITILMNKNIDTILDYAQTQFFFCFGGYAFKAIPENVTKIIKFSGSTINSANTNTEDSSNNSQG